MFYCWYRLDPMVLGSETRVGQQMSGLQLIPPTIPSPLGSPGHKPVTLQVPGVFGHKTAQSWTQLLGHQA